PLNLQPLPTRRSFDLSLYVLPKDLSRQIFDYEGILSSEFENYLARLNPGGKYKVKVYTYNSQLEILKAIESIIPKNDEIIIFIQDRKSTRLNSSHVKI